MEKSMIGKDVIVRTYSAGVHFGTLASRDGKEVVLTDARRIWYWEGAFTLSAIAMTGVSEKSKLSVEVPEILLTEAIEIIPCTEAAAANLRALKAYAKTPK
jgi:ferredoxin-fold anticodon binding domain-containing protein